MDSEYLDLLVHDLSLVQVSPFEIIVCLLCSCDLCFYLLSERFVEYDEILNVGEQTRVRHIHALDYVRQIEQLGTLLRELLDIVPRSRVVAQVYYPSKSIQAYCYLLNLQLPTAMSMVSPNILYLPLAKAMTWVLAPLT